MTLLERYGSRRTSAIRLYAEIQSKMRRDNFLYPKLRSMIVWCMCKHEKKIAFNGVTFAPRSASQTLGNGDIKKKNSWLC